MPAFTFRLESLLKLLENQRDNERLSVAEANQALSIIEAKIRNKDDEITTVRNSVGERMSGRITVDSLLSHGRYEMVLLREKQDLIEQARQIDAEREKREQQLLMADREVKRIEKMRAIAMQQHVQSEQKRMQHELDEYASVLSHRNRVNKSRK